MKLERYPKYKNTGIEWIGEIPEYWEVTRIGTRFFERKEKVSDKDYMPLSVTKQGIVPQLETAAKTNDGDNRKLVRAGDFVINSRSDRKGSSGLSSLDGSVSLINIVLEPRDIEGKFCHYLLKSNSFVEEFYRNGHGIVADLWTTRYWDMKSVMICIPPREEQIKIANFLDEKTVKIDNAITLKEQLIERLREYRQILINDAVTKGLDKTVKMKDSGVEWIGEIPEHWEVVKNKILFRERNEEGRNDLPILMVSIHTAVSSEEIDDEQNIRGKVRIQDKTNYKLVKPGNVVYNMMRAWQGAIGTVRTKGMVSPAYVVLKGSHRLNSEYFEYLYRTPLFIQQMDRYSKGITDFRKRLYWNEFKQIITLIPPLKEQDEIVIYLSEKTAQIDRVIELQQRQIDKLKEYKESLIDAIVTGKVKAS